MIFNFQTLYIYIGFINSDLMGKMCGKHLAGGGAGCWELRKLPLSPPSSKGLKPKSLLSSVDLNPFTCHQEAVPTDSGSQEATSNSSTWCFCLIHGMTHKEVPQLISVWGLRQVEWEFQRTQPRDALPSGGKRSAHPSTRCDICSGCGSHIAVSSLAFS